MLNFVHIIQVLPDIKREIFNRRLDGVANVAHNSRNEVLHAANINLIYTRPENIVRVRRKDVNPLQRERILA